MAVPSKSLWLFYLFCQLFFKSIKCDKFLFKENFLFMVGDGLGQTLKGGGGARRNAKAANKSETIHSLHSNYS